MTTETPTNAVQAPDTQAPTTEPLQIIEDVSQFGLLVSDWHANRMNRLGHLIAVPEGTEMEVNGKALVLAGELREAFIAGLMVAKAELETLPFQPVEEASDEQPS